MSLPGFTCSSSSPGRVCHRFFQQSKGDIGSSWISSRTGEKSWASPKQNVFSEETHSPGDLWCKSPEENENVLRFAIQNLKLYYSNPVFFLFWGFTKSPKDACRGNLQLAVARLDSCNSVMLSIDMKTVRVAKSYSKIPKRKQAEEEEREGYEQIFDKESF